MMKVYGHVITDFQIENAVKILKDKGDFTFNQAMMALEGCRVPSRNLISYRAADRLLQKMRKNGQIEFNGSAWVWANK